MASICSTHQRCGYKIHLSPSAHINQGKWDSICVTSAFKRTPLRINEQLWSTSSSCTNSNQSLLAVLEEHPLHKDRELTAVESPSDSQDPKPVSSRRKGRAKEQSGPEDGPSSSTESFILRISEGHAFTKAEIKAEMKIDKCTLYLAELGVEMPALVKCFDQARNVPERDWRDLLAALQEFNFTVNDIVAVLSKDPSVLGGDANRVKQLLTFSVQQGIDHAVVINMCKMWPGLLLQSVEHIINVIEYFTSVGLYREELIKIIKLRPQLLGRQLDRIRNVVDCLLDAGVPVEDLPRIMRKAPELFSDITYSNMTSNLEFLVSLGLTVGALGRAIARRPNLLNHSVEGMTATVNYLLDFMQPWDVPKLIRRYAEVLVLDPQRKIDPMVTYLLQLGVKRKDIGKVIMRRPQLLGYTIPGLEPTVKCLMEFGVKEEMIGKVITTAPQILTLNVEDKLRPVVEFFRSMGLNKERDIELLLVRNGQILCCSIERNLRPKFEFLLGLGLSTTDIATMIVLFPSMLGQSIEGSLGPKYNYLVNVMKRSVDEVIGFPQYFGYSLEKRIMPRHEKLSKKGILTSLPSMLACVDHDFEIRYLIGKVPTRAPYKAKMKAVR